MEAWEANLIVERLVAFESEPALAPDEMALLLAAARLPDSFGNLPSNTADAPGWAAATTYPTGAVVTAASPGGRWWICVSPGTSAASEPSWPDLTGAARGGATVADGGVSWIDGGSAWSPTWDLNNAAAIGWELKAAKVAGRFDFTTDGQTFRRGQMLDHCQSMARMYRRRRASNAPTGP